MGVGVSVVWVKGGVKLTKSFESENLWFLFIAMGMLMVWMTDNLLGMFSGVTLSMGYLLVLIIGVMLWVWGEILKENRFGYMTYFSHFSVVGVSGVLGVILPFMEAFSVVIRPLTLSIRLSTNITSGHVMLMMLSLWGGSGVLGGFIVFLWGWLIGLLEFFVSVLQAGIFSLLVVIYLE
uniref:ATP synthase subunit a n=1 Tax=Southwellina hispida TaxID=449650 RepID=A0A0C4MWS4_9BILA|nr:ATP synthase F0 subunit 6 [Southwellina hispida]AIO11157.1 ATP synthase F0 subunit 6 [Southwellina hispida]